MNHQDKLTTLYQFASRDSSNSQEFIQEISGISKDILSDTNLIGVKSHDQKGVYTVLVTLLTHKSLFPNQDIRFHQRDIPNGFAGRTIDTKYITPTLKKLGLPSMAESGWLTRSLEQPYPYTMDYKGNIRGKEIKGAL